MHDRRYGAGGLPEGMDAIARQYWDAWNAAMQAASGRPAPPPSPWQAALDAWSTLARGGGVPRTDDLIGRLQSQTGPWFGQMQQLAAQFAGRDAGAADIARAWRDLLGGNAGNPFADMAATMGGQGAQGFEHWLAQVAPLLESWRGEGASWLRMPAFGLGREHQERAQALAQAFVDYQRQNQDYNALMSRATENAYGHFERKLGERGDAGKPVDSARALFDLWIDAAEDAYAEIALSPEFRAAYAKLVDAQMRLRGGIQREVEQVCAAFGMPTRTELDGAHRKIVELERQMRRLRQPGAKAPAAAPVSAPRRSSAAPVANASAKRASVPVSASVAAETDVARAPAKRKTAAKRAHAKVAATTKKRQSARAQAPRSQRRGPSSAIADIPLPFAPAPMPKRADAATKSARKRR